MIQNTKVINQTLGESWTAYHADCVEAVAGLPDSSVDFSVYSPPFSSLYIYSDSIRDMGNCASDDEFIEQYSYVIKELHRATRPGRLSAVHIKDLVYYRNQNGTAGLRDLPGMIIAAHRQAGWDYHSRVTIWRDPVREMQKTKAHGLLYKTLKGDGSHTRQGLPEYLLIFRRWPKDVKEAEAQIPITHDQMEFPLEQWQQWASPVWLDTRETDVLNVTLAREDKDEKHICPMPLDLTTRAIVLWSNPGETVLSPFMGIGSEGVAALQQNRRFVGIELKESYYKQAVKYLTEAEKVNSSGNLFNYFSKVKQSVNKYLTA